MKPEELLIHPDYEPVHPDDLPIPVVYRHKGSGNSLFIAKDRRGREVVLDAYVVLKDFGGGDLRFIMRERGLHKMFKSIIRGAATVLLFVGDPRLQTIMAVFGIDHGKIVRAIERLAGKADHKKLTMLIEQFGSERFQELWGAFKEAMADGVFTAEEYEEIQLLCRKAKH